MKPVNLMRWARPHSSCKRLAQNRNNPRCWHKAEVPIAGPGNKSVRTKCGAAATMAPLIRTEDHSFSQHLVAFRASFSPKPRLTFSKSRGH
jgi:hypothetical protein